MKISESVFIVLTSVLTLVYPLYAQARETIFDHNQEKFEKLNKTDAVHTWSACSAAFQLMEESQTDPYLREVFSSRKNGANITISMIYVMDAMKAHGGYKNKNPEDYPEIVRALAISKSTGDMVMESKPRVILASLETEIENPTKQFLARLEKSVMLCGENGAVAEEYITHWREMRASGWFSSNPTLNASPN